jgi:Cft2 family RNA processing exonuclease
LWGGYSTGKAQELVKFINEYLGETPIVGGKAAEVCAAYVRAGVKLQWLAPDSAEAQEAMRGAFLSVMPPHQLTPLLAGRLAAVHRRKVLSAFATGWALVRQLPSHAAFPLSDHADFGELLQYAKESGAKRVILAHGDNEKTAAALRAAGVNAQAIESLEPQQMVLKAGE